MNPTRGILLILTAVSLFTLMSAFIKATSGSVPAGQAVFFRSVFAIPVIFVWLSMNGELAQGVRASDWRPHALRGIAGTCAMGLGFVGLGLLPLAEVTALRFVTPVFLVVFAAIVIGERFRAVRLVAVAIGLFGVSIMIWPRLTLGGFGGPQILGVAVTIGSAALAALAQVFVKAMSGTERTAVIVFYFSVTSAVLSLLTLPFGWVLPNGREALLLIGAGLIGGVGQILLTASYRYADAGALAPFTYVSMLWAIVVGFLWFGEVPSLSVLGGALLVIAAGVLIVLRERQLGQEGTARRKLRAKKMM